MSLDKKADGDHWANWLRRCQHVLNSRIASLFAIRCSKRGPNLGLSYLLETPEVFARFRHLARTLQGTGQSKLCGGMQGLESKRGLEALNRVIVLLRVEVKHAQVIIAIGVIGIDLNSPLEVVHRERRIIIGRMRQA